MNIYFQEGEFIGGGTDWLNVGVQFFGFAITIVAAYYGAKSAFNLQIKKEAKEKETELQDRFNFLNSLAARANKSIVNQVKYLEEFYKKIEVKPSFTHEHKRIALDDIKRLLILLNEEKSFQAYLFRLSSDSERYDDYNKLVYFLDYYFNGLNSIIMNIELTSKEIHEKRTLFSTYFSDYQKKLLVLISNPEYNKIEGFNQINTLLSVTYSKEEREDLALACIKFIIPIQSIIAKYVANDEQLSEAFMLGRDCILAKEEIVDLNKEYAIFFKERHKEFTKYLAALNSLIDKLKVK
jgi:hypothetical protein